MRLESVELRNYRCFESYTLDLAGESLLVVGPNAGGKSSLLAGIRSALHGGALTQSDFRDLAVPIELVAKISDIPPEAQGAFADAMDFSTMPPTLRIGTRGTWDAEELEIESLYGFPDDAWRRAKREARANLPVLFLPAWRDPTRLMRVIGQQSFLEELILGLDLDDELEQAVAAITTAGQQLAKVSPIEQLLDLFSARLGNFLPNVSEHAYTLGLHVTQPQDVLRQLDLMLAYTGPQAPATGQSGGLAQGSIFALALALLDMSPGALLLVDEPEAALHPQAQRALVSILRQQAGQSLIATHSAPVLDRSDPRMVLRLHRDGTGSIDSVRASTMTAEDAKRLSRYATSQTAEAFFAETVILVEGFSDLLAVRVLAGTLQIDLDASGLSLISLEGASLFKHYLQLLGPGGLDVQLRGLCDLDAESRWVARLADAGVHVTDRATLNAAGFQVCDPDLEAELLSPLNENDIDQVFNADDASAEFAAFVTQPENAGMSQRELHTRFVKKDKIRWAPLLAAELAAEDVPAPVSELLAGL